jgi:hypothetical protein
MITVTGADSASRQTISAATAGTLALIGAASAS